MSAVQRTSLAPVIPDHELLRRIGQGSYGEVWLSRNIMGTFRAVKVVCRASFESARPYEREFTGLQKYEPISRTAPGLLSILHVGRNAAEGYFYSVMEIADDANSGASIDPARYTPRTLATEMTAHRQLPLRRCIELGMALARTLEQLHSNGLVHRDVKPSNIIFVRGVPKLADIGLVTRIGSKASFVGTEGYVPPEGPGTPGADLFSLGMVLYEISMGKAPDEFPELPSNLREMPDAAGMMRLNGLILKACNASVAKRFASAADFIEALAEIGKEHGVGVKSTSLSERPAGAKNRAILLLSASPEGNGFPSITKLTEGLEQLGLKVFLHEQPKLSVDWARNIEIQIREAYGAIFVLFQEPLDSLAVAYALEYASKCSRNSPHSPRLLHLLLGESVTIPKQVACALSGSHCVHREHACELQELLKEIQAGLLLEDAGCN